MIRNLHESKPIVFVFIREDSCSFVEIRVLLFEPARALEWSAF